MIEKPPLAEPTAEAIPAPPTDEQAQLEALVRRRRRLSVGVGEDNQGLFRAGLGAVAVIIFYLVYTANLEEVIHLYLGVAIIILAAVPGLIWSRGSDNGFPVFEVFMLTCANTYALPLLTGHEKLVLYDSSVITNAALSIVAFQVVAISTYFLVKARPKNTPFWSEEMISEEHSRFLAYGMTLTTAYTIVAGFFNVIPAGIEGPARAVFFGIGIACTFITCRKWGLGTLKANDKSFFVFNLIVQVIMLTASLFLVGGISILVLGLLGYVAGSRRLPYAVILVLLPIIGLLHNGKSEMRSKHWNTVGERTQLTDLPAFFTEWIGYGWPSEEKKQVDSTTAKLLERTSLFHIMCLVVSVTPEKQPYLFGKSYGPIPGQFIPRFFWPDKPQAHVSTSMLGIYYGLQSAEDTKKTTIGFGMITEAYANFGLPGIMVLGFLIGMIFKKLGRWALNSPTLSYGGILLVMLMAWSFQVELTMAIWLSSLFQACVAMLGIPLAIRSVFG